MERARQKMSLFSAAAGHIPSQSAKKRPREEPPTPTMARPNSQRPNPFSSPFSTLSGRSDLHDSRRASKREFAPRYPSGSTDKSQRFIGGSNMAETVFPLPGVGSSLPPTGPGSLPEHRNNSFPRTGQLEPDPASHFSTTGSSPEADKTPGDYCFTDAFERSTPPAQFFSTPVEPPEPTMNGQEMWDSEDPIDVISNPPAQPVSKPKSRPVKDREHIVIEDDDDRDDQAVENILSESQPRPQPTPRTPTGKTPFQSGRVLDIVRTTDSNNSTDQHAKAMPNLGPRLASQTGKKVSSIRSSGVEPQPEASSKPATKISAGFTRKKQPDVPPPPPRQNVAKGMKPKRREGLIVNTMGVQKDAHATSRDSSRNQPATSIFGPQNIKILEWHCGTARHGFHKNGRDQHYFLRNSPNMVTLGNEDRLVLMTGDIDELQTQVTEPPHLTDTGEFLPGLVIRVTEKFTRGESWRRFATEHSDRLIMVKFDLPDGGDNWVQLVDRFNVGTRSIIKSTAMKSLLDQFNFAAFARASKKQVRKSAKVQQDEEPAKVPPAMFKSTARPRTRAATNQPNDEPKDATRQTPPAPVPIQDPDELMLVYPQSGPGAVNVNRAELLRLEDGEFLNDTLIEIGLKLWLDDLRIKEPELVDQIHVFNSFFFKKLDGGRGKTCDYNSVKKWTSKIDLFKKKFIIVPINEHLHWYLAVIYLPEHVLRAPAPQPVLRQTRNTRSNIATTPKGSELRVSEESDAPTEATFIIDVEAGSPMEQGQMEVDSDLAKQSQGITLEDTEMKSVSSEAVVDVDDSPAIPQTPTLDMTDDDLNNDDSNGHKCWILIFDSLRGKHTRTIRILREYLKAEAQERHQKEVETKDAKLSGGLIEDKHLPVPQQPNWCDCGVYLLHYVESFVANPLRIIAHPGPSRKSPPVIHEGYAQLWRTAEIRDKRKSLRKTVIELSESWRASKLKVSEELPNESSADKPPIPSTHSVLALPGIGDEPSLIEIAPPFAAPESGPVRTGTLPDLSLDMPLPAREAGELSSSDEIETIDLEDDGTSKNSEPQAGGSSGRGRRRNRRGQRQNAGRYKDETYQTNERATTSNKPLAAAPSSPEL